MNSVFISEQQNENLERLKLIEEGFKTLTQICIEQRHLLILTKGLKIATENKMKYINVLAGINSIYSDVEHKKMSEKQKEKERKQIFKRTEALCKQNK